MRQLCSVQKDYERWQQETLQSQQIPLIKRGAHKNSPSVRTVVETTHEDGKPAQRTNQNAMGVGALATGRITVSAPKLNNEDKAAKTEMDQISGTGAGHNQDQGEDHTTSQ